MYDLVMSVTRKICGIYAEKKPELNSGFYLKVKIDY